jgi:TP53 regulating kinase-like protein
LEEVARLLEEKIGLSPARIIAVGAEAVLVEGVLSSEKVVAKYRLPKPYRDPQLDVKLRKARTSLEARLLAKAGLLGVNVPDIVYLDAEDGLLVMSYIEGLKLKEVIEKGSNEEILHLLHRAGSMVASLHMNGIIHGDLTTSNFLVSGNDVWLVDFGLGFFSQREEDKGTDLHLFLRVLESTHPISTDLLFSHFIEGYRERAGDESTQRVLSRMREIRLRGRYVASRRKGLPGTS